MTVRKQIETQNLYTGSSDSLTFPLTRDLTHDLGDGRGETFLSQGFAKGAAAAYSLRALGSYNEPVVRVRREPHDEDEAINDEQNFTAYQVSGGELENWVNGKLESTLPADSSQGLTVVVQHSLINSGTETTIKFYADSLTSGSPRFFSNDKTYKFYKGLSDNRYILQLTDSTNLIKASASDADKLPQDVTTYESVTGTLTSITVTSSSPAAAAYSLRKVDSSYSGDAVRIRRSSDNVEVDVDFDSDDKVSLNSAITNVAEQGGESGQTTATTLGGFINSSEDFSDFKVDSEWSDNLASFSSVGKTSFSVQAKSLGSFNSTDTVRVSAPITNIIAEPQASVTKFKTTFTIDSISGEGNGDNTDGALYIKGANSPNGNGSWNFHNSPDGAGGDVTFKFTSAGTYTVEGYGEDETDAYNLAFKTFAFIIYSGTQVSVSNVSMEVLNDCTVHTLYNQSGDGSNGATQATDTKQPKIASSGTLLDHLLFDGTDDFLVDTNVTFEGAVTLACLSEKAADGLYPISAARQGATNRFFGIQEQTSASAFLPRNNTSGATVTTTASGNTRLTFARTNADTDQAVASMGRALSTGTNDYGNTPTASLINHFVIGALTTGSGGTPDLGTWNGKIFEAIGYQTDQSANRFKIESNINNYYGLYNDELELNGEALPASSAVIGGVTYSSGTLVTLPNKNSLEYTLNDVETGNRFMRYMVNPNGNLTNLSNGDKVYISFNLTAPDGLLIIAQLRDNFTGVSGTASFSGSGFKSFSLTRNSTAGTIDNIMFQSSGVGNATISMTDIKISRIARDGFVETLYDQSGNGRDISQDSASNQPTIVSNGGIYKSGAYPSIRYTDTSATYLVTESYSPVEQGGSGMPNFTLFAVTGIPESAGFDSIVSAGGSEGSNSIGGFKLRHLKDASGNIDSRIDIAQTGVSPHQANAQSNNATPQSVNLLTSYLDSTDDELFAQQNSATSGTTTTTLIPLSGQGAENDNLKVGTDMFNDSPRASYLGEILEIILYTDSKKSDLSDLTDEINNFYNI